MFVVFILCTKVVYQIAYWRCKGAIYTFPIEFDVFSDSIESSRTNDGRQTSNQNGDWLTKRFRSFRNVITSEQGTIHQREASIKGKL